MKHGGDPHQVFFFQADAEPLPRQDPGGKGAFKEIPSFAAAKSRTLVSSRVKSPASRGLCALNGDKGTRDIHAVQAGGQSCFNGVS